MTATIIETDKKETNKKTEIKLRSPEEVLRRYKRVLNEASKYEPTKDKEIKKFNHIVHIQLSELRWMLCQDQ